MPRRTRALARSLLPATTGIERGILLMRGHRVMLDSDLAELYGVATKALNQAVARNVRRFPQDFSVRLTRPESANLKSQSVTSSSHGGRRTLPRLFTEQGVALLSSVLKSRRAVDVNVAIMRALVRLRELAGTHRELAQRIDELEKKYDGQFAEVFGAIRELALPAERIVRPRIGFTVARE